MGFTPANLNVGNDDSYQEAIRLGLLVPVGGGFANPMTTAGDIITAGIGGAPQRLPIGMAGQVLSVSAGAPGWVTLSDVDFVNPMTTQDDIIVGGIAGVGARLAKGADGFVLTVDPASHHLAWAALPAGFVNPMTTAGDLILGGVAGAATRLAKGADSQVLTVDPATHLPLWATPAAGFTDPTTTKGDLIVHGASTTRLGVGANAQVLTADSTTSSGIKWAALPVGFVDPTTTTGDLIYRSAVTDVALAGTATSADSDGGHVASLVNDGSDATYWSSTGGDGIVPFEGWPRQVQIDLGSQIAVSSWRVLTPAGGAGAGQNFVTNFDIQGSNDAATWTNIVNYTYAANVGDSGVVNFGSPQTYRYFRVSLNSGGGARSYIFTFSLFAVIITRLPIGTAGQELTVVGGLPAWATPAAGFADPTTTKGDLIVHGASTTRLPVGTNGQTIVADSTQANGLKWVSGSAYAARAHPSADNAMAGDNTLRLVTLDVEDYDVGNNFAASLYTAPVAGLYIVAGSLHWITGAAAGDFQIYIGINGNNANAGSERVRFLLQDDFGANVVDIFALSAGDTVGLYARQSSGGNVSIYHWTNDTWMSVAKIG